MAEFPAPADPAIGEPMMLWADEARRLLRPSFAERIYANYQSYAGKGTAEAAFGSKLFALSRSQEQIRPHQFFSAKLER